MDPSTFLSDFVYQYNAYDPDGSLGESEYGYPLLTFRDIDLEPIWNLFHLLPAELEGILIENCGIPSLPPGLTALPDLYFLHVHGNPIVSVSADELPVSLVELDLSGNKIQEIPPGLGKLQNLGILVLANNEITEVPPWISELQSIDLLDVSGNPLRSVSEEILRSSIADFDISNTGLPSLPYAIVANRNLHITYNPDRDLVHLPKSYRNMLSGNSKNLGGTWDILVVGKRLAYLIKSTDENYTWFYTNLDFPSGPFYPSIAIEIEGNHILAKISFYGNPDYRGYLGLLSVALSKDLLEDGSIIPIEQLPLELQEAPWKKVRFYDNYAAVYPSIYARNKAQGSAYAYNKEEYYQKVHYNPAKITKKNVRTYHDLERDYYLREMLDLEQEAPEDIRKRQRVEEDEDEEM